MIHWFFLILAVVLAFVAGLASCYITIYQLAKIYGQIMEAVKEATKSVRFEWC